MKTAACIIGENRPAFPFGIMFHHFHDDVVHTRSQGSMDAGQLRTMLAFLRREFQLLNPDEWLKKALKSELQGGDICLTFDDNLKCQFDIALPVLEEFGIKAFWFLYTSPFVGVMERLEVYRHFRCNEFSCIETFYEEFFRLAQSRLPEGASLASCRAACEQSGYASDCSLYTSDDRLFRYLRDVVLGFQTYNELMNSMIAARHYRPDRDILWMAPQDILHLHAGGHIIGLHSHTHPTCIIQLPCDQQREEYAVNQTILQQITGSKPRCVSYPCGWFNADTESIMHQLGVVMGFDATWTFVQTPLSPLRFPRLDHAQLLRILED